MLREVTIRSKSFLKVSPLTMRVGLLWLAGLFLFSLLVAWTFNLGDHRLFDGLRRYALQIFLGVALLHLYFATAWRPLFSVSKNRLAIAVLCLFFYGFALKVADFVIGLQSGPATGHRHSMESLHQILLSLILAPLLEELFFRDLVFRSLVTKFDRLRMAIILSSLFFMIAHGSIYPGAFLLGVISCGLVVATESIWPSIIFHWLSNLSWFFLPALFPNLYRGLVELRVVHWFFH